jgi:hypothetical protein
MFGSGEELSPRKTPKTRNGGDRLAGKSSRKMPFFIRRIRLIRGFMLLSFFA